MLLQNWTPSPETLARTDDGQKVITIAFPDHSSGELKFRKDDGQKVITIAHPEHSSGELKSQ